MPSVHPRRPSSADRVTYLVKNGKVEICVEGPPGQGLIYVAMGIAAQQSFVRNTPMDVLEDGKPIRIVTTVVP